MSIKNIAVIGAGTMGNGIAHVFAMNSFKTYLVDTEQTFVDKGIKAISANMDRQIKKGMYDVSQKELYLKNIIPVVNIETLPEDIDLAIEAIIEDKTSKLLILDKLDRLVKNECIICTNTSSISITELSKNIRAEKFLGMHFMNPVPMMKLVEIIRGYLTTQETFEEIKELAIKIGKVPVEVYDYPGFVANRVLMPMINEAIFALYENVANAKDIDTVLKLGMSHPMGPLELADFIGLDVCLAILDVLYEGFKDSKYRACPMLRKMVAAGKLGRKTKEGFYQYT